MARIHAGAGLLIALGLHLAPVAAAAQPAGTGEPEPEVDPATQPVGDDDDDDDDDDDEDADPLEILCKLDPDNCPQDSMSDLAKKDVVAEMYAVQQIYALRRERVEVNLYAGLSLNDQFVGHPGPGINVTYFINNVVGVGLNGNFYQGLNSISDFNFAASRAARIGQPITEYQFSANAQVEWVPAYGKFAGFQNFIFHYDLYVLAGGGVISTRPIAVVDPDNRTFDFTVRPTFGAGGGIRIFFNRWLAIMLEVRDYIFFDELENPSIATGFDESGNPRAQDESTWLADGVSFTNNVQAQLGLSVFLPFSWKYRLPK